MIPPGGWGLASAPPRQKISRDPTGTGPNQVDDRQDERARTPRVSDPYLESRTLVHPAADAIGDAFWVATRGWKRLISASAGFERVFGLEREEAIRDPSRLRKVVHPEDLAAVEAVIQRVEAVGAGELEYRIVWPSGEVRWVHSRAFVQPAEDGGPHRIVGFTTDVTERRRAEEARRESEARFRSLFNHAFEAILVFDPDAGRFIDCNPAALRLFGMEREALLAATPAGLSAKVQAGGRDAEGLLREKVEEALTESSATFDWSVIDGEGKSRECQVRLTVLPMDGRRLLRASMVDVTETRQLEAQLRHAQRMEAVGRLAGGIAHDFNNVLSIIVASADLLRRQLGDEEARLEHLDDIQAAADRAAALTRQLLAFSRKQVLAPRVVDLGTVVGQVVRLIRRLIGEDVQVEYQQPSVPMPVDVDVAQFEQVLLNLAVNARDAMPAGGRLSIDLSTVHVERGARFAGEEPPEGTYVRLSVSDDGEGMDEATLQRIFEPFFTTKDPGKGTGLGLSTVYGIVKQSGGHIRVRSRPGHGTRFEILFPRSTRPVVQEESRPAETSAAVAAGWILVVEDDALLRQVLRRMLEAAGFRVLAAGSVREALAAGKAHLEDLALLLVDVVMPGRSGVQLAAELSRLHPDLPVVFMTGYVDGAASGRLPEGARLLRKPFSQQELLRAVRRALKPTPEPGARPSARV